MKLEGLGKLSRERLAKILRDIQGPISVLQAANILRLSRLKTAQLMSRWAKKGWLSRIKRGLYMPVPIEARHTDIVVDDPWLLASRLFEPCYVGGWSAAEHWDLTEQIFTTVVVFSSHAVKDSNPKVGDVSFLVKRVAEKRFFGLARVWKGTEKVQVSDPTHTIIDILDAPSVGGGIVQSVEIFQNYMRSKYKDTEKLIRYGGILGRGSVFKRLGYLTDRFFPDEMGLISACLSRLSQGNSKLDPNISCEKLVTRWKLWVPKKWHEKAIS